MPSGNGQPRTYDTTNAGDWTPGNSLYTPTLVEELRADAALVGNQVERVDTAGSVLETDLNILLFFPSPLTGPEEAAADAVVLAHNAVAPADPPEMITTGTELNGDLLIFNDTDNAFVNRVLSGDATIDENGVITVTATQDADTVVLLVEKDSAGTINPGQVVRIISYDGGPGNPTVELAQADAAGTMPALGIARETITDTVAGEIVISGTLVGIDTSLFSVGDELFVDDAVAGGLVNTKPDGTALIQKMAQVTRSDAVNGTLQVFGAGRSNDLPNIPEKNLWIGDANGVPAATPNIDIDGTITGGDLRVKHDTVPDSDIIFDANGRDGAAGASISRDGASGFFHLFPNSEVVQWIAGNPAAANGDNDFYIDVDNQGILRLQTLPGGGKFGDIIATNEAVLYPATDELSDLGQAANRWGNLYLSAALNLSNTGGDQITVQAQAAAFTGYTLTLPPNDGDADQFLQTDGAGVLSWATVDSGLPEFAEFEDLPESSSTNSGYTQATRFTTASLPAGDYLVLWSADAGMEKNKACSHRVQLDDTTTLTETSVKFEAGQITNRSYMVMSGSAVLTLTAGTHNFDFDYDANGDTAYMKNVRLQLWKVA